MLSWFSTAMGCGSSHPREELELNVETLLAQNGWERRCAAICIEPELENWVWSSSPHVAAALEWHAGELDTWLVQAGHRPPGAAKPVKPKEAMEAALRIKRIPRSSAIYSAIAGKVSFDRCTDPAFLKLRGTLRAWFPAEAA